MSDIKVIDVRTVPDKEGFLHRGEIGVYAKNEDWRVWGFGPDRDSALRDAEMKIRAAEGRYAKAA